MNREHLRTILWLRWRLTRNQWAKSGGLGAAIAVVIGVGSVGLGLLSFGGALAIGALALRSSSPHVIQAIWWATTCAFLLFWMVGVIAELQRSETIDLQKLLHLPVSLGPMFLVNYLASHLALSLVIAVPGMVGLALGLAFAKGPAMLLLIPLALSMVLMITAWTYCVRGWLASMISNPRRRRAVVVGLTFSVVLLGQLPNLYFNVIHPIGNSAKSGASSAERKAADRAEDAQLLAEMDRAERFIPPLWLPGGAHALAEGRALPAALGILGCLGLWALGLITAFRSTLRMFRGETGGRGAEAAREPEPIGPGPIGSSPIGSSPVRGNRLIERQLPWVPEPAAAVATATLQSMLRAPEVQMLWGTSFLVTLVIGSTFLVRGASHLPASGRPFVVTGAMAFAIFMQVQCFANPFGFDREGFRALVLSPIERRMILLGKNLAFLPIGVGLGLFLLLLSSIWFRLPPAVMLSELFQLATMLLTAAMVGNLLAIVSPYRVGSGTLKPTKMPPRAMLVLVACQLLFPMTMSPALAPPLAQLGWVWMGGSPQVPVSLLLSILLAAAAIALYAMTLGPLGRLLQRREMTILGLVTSEVE